MIRFPQFTFSWMDVLRRFFDGTSANAVGCRGTFHGRHARNGVVIAERSFGNAATIVGRNYLNNVGFDAGTRIDNWYLGLIDNASFTALSENDSMSSHSGWIELTAYDEATRVEWAPSASASALITSTAKRFTANDSKTLKGAFVTSVSTKGGNTGTLWATGILDSTQALVAADTYDLIYKNELVAVA